MHAESASAKHLLEKLQALDCQNLPKFPKFRLGMAKSQLRQKSSSACFRYLNFNPRVVRWGNVLGEVFLNNFNCPLHLWFALEFQS